MSKPSRRNRLIANLMLTVDILGDAARTMWLVWFVFYRDDNG